MHDCQHTISSIYTINFAIFIKGGYADIGYLDSEGFYINLTKNRFKSIEKELKESFVTIDNKHHFFKDFNYKILKNSVKIYSNLFEIITQNYESNQVKLVALVKSRYIESFYSLHNCIVECILEIVPLERLLI